MSIAIEGLHSGSMRELGDFIEVRAAKLGMNQEALIAATGMGKQTIVNLIKLKDDKRLPQNVTTLETIAEHLNFRTWLDLIDAWNEDDVVRGLPPISATATCLQWVARERSIDKIHMALEKAGPKEVAAAAQHIVKWLNAKTGKNRSSHGKGDLAQFSGDERDIATG